MSKTPSTLSRSLVGAALLSLLPAAAGAVQHEVQIYLDLDNDTGTGCEVTTVAGTFAGAEQVLITTVETSSPPDAGTVTDVAVADCVDEVTDTFGPPASFDGLWDVGIGNGVGGRDVVETYVPLLQLVVQDPSIVHLGVVVSDELGGEEALLTVDGTPGGAPILLDLRSVLEIPTLGEWALILLALLLAAASVYCIGRMGPRGTAALGLALLVLATGVAWAADVLDGLTDDWFASDQLASNGLVLFGKGAADRLCFRVDADLLFNQPPVAEPDAFATDEDTALAGENVLADNGSGADSDPEAAALTVTTFDSPSTQGAAVTVAANGDLTYDPTAVPAFQALDDTESVDDTFTYTIEDPSGASDTATVTVTVDGANDAPTAMDDTYETDEDVPLVISAPGVLMNDADVDVEPISAVLDTDVSNGTLTLDADGSFTYTPDPDFNGVDSFTYHANDGTADSPIVTATITVGPVNDGPNAVDDLFAAGEDAVLNVPADGVLNNDTDPEMDPISVTSFDATSANGATVSVSPDGSFSYDPTGAAALQALDDGESLSDTFTYTIDDGSGNPDTATVTVEVSGANDAPVADDDAFSTDEDVALNASAPGVLDGDTDVDVETLSAVLVTGPANADSFVLNGDGSFDYTPAPNFNGSDSFTYRASDGTTTSNLATVTITIDPVNDAPVADDETVAVACNLEHVVEAAPGETAAASAPIFRTVADNVLVGDSDPVEMSAVAIVQAEGLTSDASGPDFTVTTNQGGTVTLHADGSFVYTPEGGDRNLADTFTYTLQDAEGAQDTATVTLNVADVCVWFVDNAVNPTDGDGDGTSSDPFSSLVDESGADALPDDAEDASQPGDVTYVFTGESRTGDPYLGGYAAQANETILGEGVDLVVDLGSGPETLFDSDELVADRPLVEVATGSTFSVTDVTGVEIAGFEITTEDDSGVAVEAASAAVGASVHHNTIVGDAGPAVDVSSAFAGPSVVSITDNTLAAASSSALRATTSGGVGILEIAIDDNTEVATSVFTGGAIELDGELGGTLYVTSFCGNQVSGDTAGAGILVNRVTFDADPSDPDFTGDAVVCATGTTIGSAGNPVTNAGLKLGEVIGDLDLGQLDVWAGTPGGVDETALQVVGLGAFNVAGTGFQLTTDSGTVSTLDGPALSITEVDLESAVLTSVVSQNSNGEGISISDSSGSLQVTGSTTVDTTGDQGIRVETSSTDVTFVGPLSVSNTSDEGIALSQLSGSFSVLDATSSLTGSADADSAFASEDGSGDVTFAGSITNTAGLSVDIRDHGGGVATTILFTGAIDDDGAGIFLTNNDQGAGSTVTFSGGLDLDTGTNEAFVATEGGTVNVLSDGVSTTADTTTGTLVRIVNTTIGAGGVTFDSTSKTGGADGIVLTQVGSGDFLADAGSIANQTNRGVDVSGGSGNITIDPSISTTTTGRSVEVTTHTGGTVDVNGAIDDDGLGIRLANNVGAVLRFDGGVDVDTSAASGTEEGLEATGGGVLHVTGTNAVDTSLATGIAVNIAGGTTIGPDGVTFENVSANGAPSGIVLDSTGSSGAFTVTGDGSMTGGVLDRDGSGGSIVATGSCIELTSSNDVTVRQLDLTNCGDHAIEASGGSDHVFSAVTIQNPANHGWEATNLTGVNRIDHGSLVTQFNSVNQDGVRLVNTDTDFTSFTVDNVTFSNSATGNDGFFHRALGGTTGSIVVTGSTFTGLDADGVQVANDGSETIDTTIQGNTFMNADATGGDGNNGLALNLGGSGIHQFLVGGPDAGDENSFTTVNRLGDNSGVINVTAAGAGTGATSRIVGTIQRNSISDSDGRRGISALFEASGGTGHGGHSLVIDGNDVNDVAREGIYVGMSSVAGRSNTGNRITIRNNNVGDVSVVSTAGNREGIEIEAFHDGAGGGSIEADILVEDNVAVINNTDETFRVTNDAFTLGGAASTTLDVTALGNTFTNLDASGDSFEHRNFDAGSTSCLDVNAANQAPDRNNSNRGYLIVRDAGTFGIEGLAAGTHANAAVNTFVDARNDGGASAASGNNFTGGVTCSLP